MPDGVRHNSAIDPVREQRPREKLLTVDEFVRLGELGAYDEPGKHELWDGRVMMSPPPGGPRMDRERRITETLILSINAAGLRGTFGVFNNGGLQIGEFNLRAPDIMVAPLPFDTERRLTGERVALVVEVSHSSLPDDLTEKRGKYAGAGIPEYWVVDVEGRRLYPFRNPSGGDYPDCEPLEAGAAITPLFAPQMTLAVADLV
jgi:Uma2 family endonuclease